MKPMVITFTTMEDFDRLMLYATQKNVVWRSGTHPSRTPIGIRAGVQDYLRQNGVCTLCFDSDGHMGYSSEQYHRNDPLYNDYEFKAAREVLKTGIDCTIPETEETT